jgi:hypothetical protein
MLSRGARGGNETLVQSAQTLAHGLGGEPAAGPSIAAMGNRPALKAALVAVALAALAFAAVHGSLERPVRWSPDGLYYQARLLELRGAAHDEAYDSVFEGPMAARLRADDPDHIGDPAWVAYNERFFERRVAVPLAGAALEPAAGERALSIVSIAGFIAAVLAVFGLLLLRFRLSVAAVVAAVTALLPRLTDIAPLPLTDTWGLALMTAALAFAVLALDRGPRWVWPWAGAIALLTFTRDSTWIPVLAVAWCAFRLRSRTPVLLVAAGVLAALPAYLMFEAPMRELLAAAVDDMQPNPDASWVWIAQHYPAAIVEHIRGDLGYVRQGAWFTGAYLAGGIVLLFALGRGADPARMLMRAAAVVALLYVFAVPVFSALRIELVFVPAAAFGLAAGLERLRRLAGGTVAVPVPAGEPAR